MYGAVSFFNTMSRTASGRSSDTRRLSNLGADLTGRPSIAAGERPYYNLFLLAKNLEGYQNLVYLASKAFTEGFHYKPRIDLELLAERSVRDLIALSGRC